MRDQHGNNASGMVVTILGIAVFGYLILRQLSDSLGVDVNAALSLVMGVALTLAFLAAGVWCQATDTWPLTFLNVSPLALSTLILGFSPTLHQLGTVGPSFIDFGTQWWGRTSLHYGIVFVILAGGYGYFYLTRDR